MKEIEIKKIKVSQIKNNERKERISLNKKNLGFFLTDLGIKVTGLPMRVFVLPDIGGNPRIAVAPIGEKNFSNSALITLNKDPKLISKVKLSKAEFAMAKDFIKLNNDLLIQYWNNEIDSRDLLDHIKPTNITTE